MGNRARAPDLWAGPQFRVRSVNRFGREPPRLGLAEWQEGHASRARARPLDLREGHSLAVGRHARLCCAQSTLLKLGELLEVPAVGVHDEEVRRLVEAREDGEIVGVEYDPPVGVQSGCAPSISYWVSCRSGPPPIGVVKIAVPPITSLPAV